MRTSFAILALTAASAVSAQRKVFSAADINPGAISIQTKASWCTGERDICNVLCNRAPTNDCDPTTLEYSCLCSNGSAPGLEYYKQTLPTFICLQAFDDCISANVGNSRGQQNCTDSIMSQCGTIDAQAEDAKPSTTSATATPTGASTTGSGSGTQASSAPSNTPSGSFAGPTAAPAHLGNAVAVAAVGLFAYML